MLSGIESKVVLFREIREYTGPPWRAATPRDARPEIRVSRFPARDDWFPALSAR